MLVKAAQYWRVPPWELLRQPTFWTNLANLLETEEAKAAKSRQKRASRKRGSNRR